MMTASYYEHTPSRTAIRMYMYMDEQLVIHGATNEYFRPEHRMCSNCHNNTRCVHATKKDTSVYTDDCEHWEPDVLIYEHTCWKLAP